MFGIRYMKVRPTDYILHYRGSKILRQGEGLSFLYFAPTANIVLIPTRSTDLQFIFNEMTKDFQPITLQGQMSYRVTDPEQLAKVLDFSINSSGHHISEDPEHLQTRLVSIAQVCARSALAALDLRAALAGTDQITSAVLSRFREYEPLTELGVTIQQFELTSLKTSPEMERALESEAREGLQLEADMAIYERRNAAVEQERIIRENELNTEIAVEQKQREIRETQMNIEIAVEEKKRIVEETKMAAQVALEFERQKLIKQKVENDRKMADSKAYELETSIKPVRDLDWRVLMALNSQGNDPATMIALAFRDMAENAGKIGELNISPDLLHSLVKRS
jgi:hypothetical protein